MWKKNSLLFATIFIEGFSVMFVELGAAKLLAPFYGSSLYVWTAVLINTIFGLSAGYFLGGRICRQAQAERKLYLAAGAGALLLFILPYIASAAIHLTSGLDIVPGAFTGGALLIIPPLICFGTIGPVSTQLLYHQSNPKKNHSGQVFFVSTVGGIVATFLFGYYLIPNVGLKTCSLFAGALLAIFPIVYLLSRRTDRQEKERQNDQSANALGKSVTVSRGLFVYVAVEGALALAVELIGARMMAPYFGASLLVWSTVIGCSFLGLAIGYFYGEKIGNKKDPLDTLQWVLLAAAAVVSIMHFSATQLTLAFEKTSFETGALFTGLLLIGVPMTLLGTVPTLLIRHITNVSGDAGSVAGKVYGVSSLCGILSLMIFGFWLIPAFGLTMPSIAVAIAAGLLPFVRLLSKKKYASLVFLIFIAISFATKINLSPTGNIEVQHYSEGLMGQVLVADVKRNTDSTSETDRILFVNRIGETFINRTTGATEANYLVYVSCLASKFKEHSSALLLGLGGGTIANMLHNDLKFDVDVAELDDRIKEVSKEYFSLNDEIHVTTDDARHYLETSEKKYDLIFFDVFRGDIPPPHVLSLESFKKAESLLNKNGMIIVNFFGFLDGDYGTAARAIYKTLSAAGLYTRILPTTGLDEERNLLFVASAQPQDFKMLRTPLYLYGKPVDIDTLFVERKTKGLTDATVLTDDKPILDVIVRKTTDNFRRWFDNEYIDRFRENGVPIFK